jgi:phosphodiesterase/alkaline phosphatase D-like protein
MGKSSSQIIGYWYHPAFHMGLGYGPADALLEIRGGDKTAWSGELTASGTITINKPNLFGGEKDQGGIQGDMDVMFGEATQTPNAYLTSTFGNQQPAWRGLMTVVFKGGKYGAMNPYPQKISYKWRKIKMGWDGDPGDGSACWYAEKAQIVLTADTTLPADADGWEYQVLPYTDEPLYTNLDIPSSGWTEDGQGPFSSNTGDTPAGNVTWPQDTILWVRRSVTIAAGGPQLLTIIVENSCLVFINGAIAGAVNRSNAQIPNNQNNTFTFTVQPGQTYDIAVKAADEHPSTGGTFLSVAIAAPGLTAMNPAHILYYAKTQQHMGREPVASMSDASFRAAADWYFNQAFGLCTQFDASQESIDAFSERIEKVAGCSVTRSPSDGLYYCDVANGDYDIDSLPVLTDDDILAFTMQPATLDSAINSVSVQFFDPQQKTTVSTRPVEALALVSSYGRNHQDTSYPEIPTSDLALRVAQRDLQSTATPTHGFEITATRVAHSWRKGTYFRMQAPKHGVADMVCIVGDPDSGTLASGAIKFTAVEDIYSLPASSFAEQETGVDTRPPQIPLAIMQQAAFEAPYIEIVQRLSRADLAALPDDVGYAMAVAKDPATSRDFTMSVSTDGGTTYADKGNGEFTPNCLIVEGDALTDAAPVTNFTFTSGDRLDQVEVGSVGMWDGEWVRVDALDVGAGTLTLGRGCADTPPAMHAANSRVWFYQGAVAAGTTEYTDGEAIDVELLTNTGSDQVDPELATPLALTFDQRQARPYPPAHVQINGNWYPSAVTAPISITFNHRDRVNQADQLIDYSAASVGPETGVTYTLRGYIGDTLDNTVSGADDSPISWTPTDSGTARVELVSVREGIESNVWEHTFNVSGAVAMSTTPTASVSPAGARISLRAAAASTVAMKYSTNDDLSDATVTSGVAVDSTTDFTCAIDIASLAPDTVYYYTPKINGADQYSSGFPTFKTFPTAGTPVSFSFAFGSCTRHAGVGADSIFSAVPAGARFLMHIGDTIYADADGSPASTLAQYRSKHEAALAGADSTDAGWKSLRAAHPVFTMWDDHELTNNFDGGTSDALYAPAKQAFQEYHGHANPDPVTSGELYYTFQYGDVGFFVADLRSFRSTETDTDDASKTILGATQKAALKDWLLTNKTALKLKFIVASVPAHGYASNTEGDSWGGEYDSTQAPNAANGYRTERNEIWDYIDTNEIPGVVFLSGDQHWAGSFKTTYADRPRYEFMSSPLNNSNLTAVALAADAVNGPVFWKYDTGVNVGVVSIDTTVSPATVSFQLYGPSGSLGSGYLTSIDQDAIDLDLVPVPAIALTATLPDAIVGETYTGSITATNTGGATGAITLTDDSLPEGLSLGTPTGSGDGPFTWPVTGTPTDTDDDELVTEFSATNGTQTKTLDHTWTVSEAELWTPADLATPPALWLNESSALTDDGTGHVSTSGGWGDVSNPSTLYFAPGNTSIEPAINASGLNGMRTIHFDGVNDYLSGSNGVKALTSNINAFSIFIVANPAKNSTSTGARLLVFSVPSATAFMLGIDPESGNLNAWQRRLSTDSIKNASIAHSTVAWRTHQSEHDYTGQTVTLRLDGGTPVVTNTSQGSGNTATAWSNLAEMGGSSTTGSLALATDVAEVIILKYIATATDRQKIEGYLDWKWGLEANLPSDHPYKDAAPTK